MPGRPQIKPFHCFLLWKETYKSIQFDEILLLVCIHWRGFLEPWNYIRFYKGILYFHMFQNKADSHLKLREMPNCSFREDLSLHLTLALIVPCDAPQRSPQPSPQQTTIVARAPTWDSDSNNSVWNNTCYHLTISMLKWNFPLPIWIYTFPFLNW